MIFFTYKSVKLLKDITKLLKDKRQRLNLRIPAYKRELKLKIWHKTQIQLKVLM